MHSTPSSNPFHTPTRGLLGYGRWGGEKGEVHTCRSGPGPGRLPFLVMCCCCKETWLYWISKPQYTTLGGHNGHMHDRGLKLGLTMSLKSCVLPRCGDRGNVLANEAMLTGESVPQMKASQLILYLMQVPAFTNRSVTVTRSCAGFHGLRVLHDLSHKNASRPREKTMVRAAGAACAHRS